MRISGFALKKSFFNIFAIFDDFFEVEYAEGAEEELQKILKKMKKIFTQVALNPFLGLIPGT